MKKTLTTIGMALLIGIVATVFNGCKGKDGAPGATGPQGNAGVSNISTTIITTTNASWSFDATHNEWDAFLNYSAITSDIVATGSVQVYVGTSPYWGAMPLAYHNNQFNYTYTIGQVIISVTLADGTAPANPGGDDFKIVVIPSRSMMVHPDIDLKNYESAKKEFHLKD